MKPYLGERVRIISVREEDGRVKCYASGFDWATLVYRSGPYWVIKENARRSMSDTGYTHDGVMVFRLLYVYTNTGIDGNTNQWGEVIRYKAPGYNWKTCIGAFKYEISMLLRNKGEVARV